MDEVSSFHHCQGELDQLMRQRAGHMEVLANPFQTALYSPLPLKYEIMGN